ncbi:hypothetical protein IIC68_00880 [archaeon]|nr:hypothetical protein [archaeon]
MHKLFENTDPELLAKFKAYHKAHPGVYKEFKACANRMKGVKGKYSAWTIVNVIRWNYDLKADEPFKINNDFIALYARLLIYHDPSFDGFFELRKMKPCSRQESEEEKHRMGVYSHGL